MLSYDILAAACGAAGSNAHSGRAAVGGPDVLREANGRRGGGRAGAVS